VEAAWTLMDPILEVWSATKSSGPAFYPAGTWGPEESDRLLARNGHAWHTP
jgi:glucose-6-phosphate 1-dehydrogenase